jgi:hypothetical protein
MFGDPPFLLIFKELWGCNYISERVQKFTQQKRRERSKFFSIWLNIYVFKPYKYQSELGHTAPERIPMLERSCT